MLIQTGMLENKNEHLHRFEMVIEEKVIRRLQILSQANKLKTLMLGCYGEMQHEFFGRHKKEDLRRSL